VLVVVLAGGVAVAALSGALSSLFPSPPEQTVPVVTEEALDPQVMVLPDGSVVRLDAAWVHDGCGVAVSLAVLGPVGQDPLDLSGLTYEVNGAAAVPDVTGEACAWNREATPRTAGFYLVLLDADVSWVESVAVRSGEQALEWAVAPTQTQPSPTILDPLPSPAS